MRRLSKRVQGVGPVVNPYGVVLNSVMTTNEMAYAQEKSRRYELEGGAWVDALSKLDDMSST